MNPICRHALLDTLQSIMVERILKLLLMLHQGKLAGMRTRADLIGLLEQQRP
jgi:hypothetical protein